MQQENIIIILDGFMEELKIFNGIELVDILKMIKCFDGRRITYKRDRTILSNVINSNLVGIIISGSANLIRYDYNGNRSIIESLEKDSVFGRTFSYLDNEVVVVAITDCEVLLLDYTLLMNRCKKNCPCHNKLIDNVFELLSQKIIDLNERVEVLSKRSIREKVLSYLNIVAKKKGKKSFYLPLTYTELADYLSVDRSAMMREIKNLKDEGFIYSNGKKLTIKEY